MSFQTNHQWEKYDYNYTALKPSYTPGLSVVTLGLPILHRQAFIHIRHIFAVMALSRAYTSAKAKQSSTRLSSSYKKNRKKN